MKPSIGKTYMFLPTTKDVWDAIRETYSDAENASQIFEIKTRLWQMKQGDREVTEYYTEMLGLWQELDLSCEEEWECTGDSVRFKKKMENERVFEFLAGLNRELDDVRSRVLSRRPLPSIREVFSEVRREESRRRVMLDHSVGPEGSALLTYGPHGPMGLMLLLDVGFLLLDLVGQAQDSPRGLIVSIVRSWATLKTLVGPYMANPQIGSLDSPIKPTVIRPPPKPRQTKLPQKFVSQLLVWGLIPTRLGNYMSFFSNFQASGQSSTTLSSGSLAKKDAHHLFSTYSPYAGNLKVKIADGTLSPVAGKGNIRISESITLNPVLHDLSSGKTIGSAKEREGLYYFDETDVLGQSSPTVCNSTSYSKDSELLLWHKRMGHPSFQRTLKLGGDMELQTNRETLVYSRRPKSKFNETLISEALQESESVIVPTPREYDFNSDQVTDDLPIAIRKQPRSCTLRPISNFVSYNSLSAKCRAFTTNLDRIQLPKNIQEAFEIPEWKEAVMEEIRH
ncbi:hypothetical protein CK203_013737 [Vitis vinifera]|uniref:GAG-pre-integrase domain-containing protein n=1 Tax=Vitis vinifera TaxID=29760 RepID=A0A438JJQ3_VITVI|nr:hypothetical protein CK203_013737 [Vitis vinifera]